MQPANLQLATCPLCGADRTELFCKAPDRFHLEAGDLYSIQRCLQCGMVYLNPRPREEDSEQFYEHADYLPFASLTQKRSVLTQLYELLRRANLRWKRRVITDFVQRTRSRTVGKSQMASPQRPRVSWVLLDVGCGTGEFLATMKSAGWQVEGIERDERAAAWAREHYQLPVRCSGIEELATRDHQYDVITLWHVLEHLYAPGQALAILARCLRDEGWLVIAVPNVNSVEARVYGKHWVALDAPRHVNHFSLETLERLSSQRGLTLRWWRQLPLDAFFNALMSEKLAAQRPPRRATALVRLLWPVRLLRAFLVTCISLLGGSHNPFSYAAHGASLICFFEKSHRKQSG